MSLFIRCDFKDCRHIEKFKDGERGNNELPQGWRNFENGEVDADLCPEHVIEVWTNIPSKDRSK